MRVLMKCWDFWGEGGDLILHHFGVGCLYLSDTRAQKNRLNSPCRGTSKCYTEKWGGQRAGYHRSSHSWCECCWRWFKTEKWWQMVAKQTKIMREAGNQHYNLGTHGSWGIIALISASFSFPVSPPEGESGGYQKRAGKLARTKSLPTGAKNSSCLETLTGEGWDFGKWALDSDAIPDSLTYLLCGFLNFFYSNYL